VLKGYRRAGNPFVERLLKLKEKTLTLTFKRDLPEVMLFKRLEQGDFTYKRVKTSCYLSEVFRKSSLFCAKLRKDSPVTEVAKLFLAF
jgi:hypothetical protein